MIKILPSGMMPTCRILWCLTLTIHRTARRRGKRRRRRRRRRRISEEEEEEAQPESDSPGMKRFRLRPTEYRITGPEGTISLVINFEPPYSHEATKKHGIGLTEPCHDTCVSIVQGSVWGL
jgi:hypothetical protein